MRRPTLIWTLTGITAVALVVTGVSAWALTSAQVAQKQPKADAAPATPPPAEGLMLDKAGVPALYTGDELEWLLLPEQGFADVLGIDAVEAVSSAYGSVGESDGMVTTPEDCIGLVLEDFSGIVGYRARWAAESSAVGGRMDVRQFATPKAATAWADKTLSLLEACRQYTFGYYETSDGQEHRSVTVLADEDDGSAHAVVFETSSDGSEFLEPGDSVEGLVVHGNTVAWVTVHATMDKTRGEALAAALQKNAAEAYAQLERQVR